MTREEALTIAEIVIKHQDDSGGHRPQNGILPGLWRAFPEHPWPDLVMEADPEWGADNDWDSSDWRDQALADFDAGDWG